MPSLGAEIGDVIECHLRGIGMLDDCGMDDHQKAFIAKKKAEFEGKAAPAADAGSEGSAGDFPEGAQLCAKCSTKAVIKMDGCMTCLNCGDSKCG